MKKTLFVLVPSIAIGGAELLACFQAYELEKEYEVHLIVLDKIFDQRPLQEFEIQSSQVKVHELKSGFSIVSASAPLKVSSLMPSLLSLIRQHRPLLLIAHLPPSHFVARVASILCTNSFKIVQYHHGLQFEETPLDSPGKKIYNFLNRLLSNIVSEHDLFISEAVKHHYEKFFRKQATNNFVIYNAVSDEYATANAASDYLNNKGIERKKNVLVLPGRVQAAKGQLFFLPIFAHFCGLVAENDYQLIVAGGGPDEQLLRTMITDLFLEDKVVVTGTLSKPLLLSFIKMANLVVIPSLVEGLGNVAIESLMLGKQILASDAGGLKEVIIDKRIGFLFKKADADACLKQLLDYHDRSSNGIEITPSAIRKSYEERFLPSLHIRLLIDYLKICAE